MPIVVPDDLPTRWMLDSEGIFAIDRSAALRQDIRPLRIAVLVGDPDADPVALALSRLIGNSPLQIELSLVRFADPALASLRRPWLQPWTALSGQTFDAFVAGHLETGAVPVEQAGVWDEFRDVVDWAEERAGAHLFLGWSAEAALQYRYGLAGRVVDEVVTGVLRHRVLRRHSYLLRGFDDDFAVPVYRQRELAADDLLDTSGLEVLAESVDGHPYLLRSFDRGKVFALHHPIGHPVAEEAGGRTAPPWRTHAALLLSNWINYYVYQPASRQLAERDGRPAA